MSARNPDIGAFIARATRWRSEMEALREILLTCDLDETLKWGKPCYTAHGGNIAIMQPFKAHLSLMFFKGALLSDPEGILRSQGENTQAALRIEFTRAAQVRGLESELRSYVDEAIAVEKAGTDVPKKDVEAYEVPAEFEDRLERDADYRAAFEALTPGRQKSWLLHLAGAKRAATRERRIEEGRARIMEGKGFHER
ncbi:MAG: YdeI/OmpD-associated family protein [Longimicrobiales bacterium]